MGKPGRRYEGGPKPQLSVRIEPATKEALAALATSYRPRLKLSAYVVMVLEEHVEEMRRQGKLDPPESQRSQAGRTQRQGQGERHRATA